MSRSQKSDMFITVVNILGKTLKFDKHTPGVLYKNQFTYITYISFESLLTVANDFVQFNLNFKCTCSPIFTRVDKTFVNFWNKTKKMMDKQKKAKKLKQTQSQKP